MTHSILALALAAALPLLLSWLVALVPRRRKEVSNVILGNPLSKAALPVEQVTTLKPLLHLSRALTGNDIRGFIVGARHLPIEHTAPMMSRYVKGSDPALQLYAQSVLQDGVGKLQQWQQQLEKAAPSDQRATAWLIEVGLSLAHPHLASPADRSALLAQLKGRAKATLSHTPHPSSHLLSALVELALESQLPAQAQQFLAMLPEGSQLKQTLQPAITHALRRTPA
jgi:hypothetical protein